MHLIPLLLFANALFDFNHGAPFDVQEKAVEIRGEAKIRDLTFASTRGGRTAAYLVEPGKPVPRGPAVLFVHWYEPESPDSNRTQYLKQAEELAAKGVRSLLVETMWSEPTWFPKRNRNDDFENSVAQVKELQRSLDFLLSQPGIDKDRVGYVGHDFGMMFGAILIGIDSRIKVCALQAGTPLFADWYLYGPKMEEEARKKFVQKLSEIDPVSYIGRPSSTTQFLLQFGTSDRHVPRAKAEEFAAAVHSVKTVLWYESGHGLNEQAVEDRQRWLAKQLSLK